MGFTYQVFDSLPSTWVADVKAKILLSSDWSNPNGNVLKAVTPLGAQMVFDPSGQAVPSAAGLSPAFYRTYSGSTGVDSLLGYQIWFKGAAGGTTSTNPLHCTVIAGPTLLYISVEGPRPGETNPDIAGTGSLRQTIGLAQLTPYHTSDATPAVVLLGASSYPGYSSAAPTVTSLACRVSQNQVASSVWPWGDLKTLSTPSDLGQQFAYGYTPKASDLSSYLFPYVLMEHIGGIRGRLTDIFFAGINRSQNGADSSIPFTAGQQVTFDGKTYTIMQPYKGININSTAFNSYGSLGGYVNNAQIGDYYRSPLVAVRTA